MRACVFGYEFCTPKGPLQKAFLSLKGSKMMLLQKAFLFVARSQAKPLHFVEAIFGLWTWFCSSKMGAPRIVAIKRLHRCTPAIWTRIEGVWTLHFLSTLKKHRPQMSLSPVPCKKGGLLLKDNWEKRREICLFWGSGSKHASKTHTQKKIEIKRLGKRYLPTKCRGAAKSWLMHKALPFWSLFACIHSFCRLFARPRGL